MMLPLEDWYFLASLRVDLAILFSLYIKLSRLNGWILNLLAYKVSMEIGRKFEGMGEKKRNG